MRPPDARRGRCRLRALAHARRGALARVLLGDFASTAMRARAMKVVILLGPPGAGKGTQAPLLAERLGIPIVATGDLFRSAVRDGTALGLEARRYMDAGQLVPDDIVVRLLLDRLERADARGGGILDGFPRTNVQAAALDRALAERDQHVSAAVLIDVPEDEVMRRMSGRWICRAAGHPYHAVFSPPHTDGVCDIDGSELYQRADDKPDTVRERMRQQLGALGEVIAHYRESGVLIAVDGLQGINEVARDIDTALVTAGIAAPRAGSGEAR